MLRFRYVWLLSLSILFNWVVFTTADASIRVALVIGNGAYKMSPLKNPTHDAGDVSAVLESLGFNVTKVINADRRVMTMAINEFGRTLKNDSVGLFYYAGHGVQLDGVNYLLPVDALIFSEHDIPFESVSANRVLAHMEGAGNALNIVIFDACRNNPYARSFRNSQNGLAHMDPPRGSLVVFATDPNNVAVDGEGRNGTFTKNFLKYIRHKNLELGPLMRKVRAAVEAETEGIQSPYEVSNVKGEFFFAADSAPIETDPKANPLIASLPPETKGIKDFDAKLEVIQRWKEWQTKMAVDFKKVQGYDRSVLTPDEKVMVWQSFMDAYGAENPYSDDDAGMRNTAKSRLGYWKSQIEALTTNKKVKVASISPEITRPGIETTDRHYQKLSNGIVYDKLTGLEWYVGPDNDTDLKTAQSWVSGLTIDGGNWRLPSLVELKTLYSKHKGINIEHAGKRHLSPLLKTRGRWVWSKDYRFLSFSYAVLRFDNGKVRQKKSAQSESGRVFAVRSGN